jgi:hypothetical protein
MFLSTQLLILMTPIIHVRCVPCHQGMARPQVADGGDALQVRRVAANISVRRSVHASIHPSLCLSVYFFFLFGL